MDLGHFLWCYILQCTPDLRQGGAFQTKNLFGSIPGSKNFCFTISLFSGSNVEEVISLTRLTRNEE